MQPIFCQLAPADTSAAGAICYFAFKSIADQHGFPADFPDADVAAGFLQQLLSRDDIHGIKAEIDGRCVGSNFLWEDGRIAGVGPITVDPGVQNGGIGRQLMQSVIERAGNRGMASVRLVQAAYHGRSLSLYTQLGFDAREALSVMQGPAINTRIDGYRVRAAIPADMEQTDALHLRLHGFTRSGELRAALREGRVKVVEHGGRITGYTTGVAFFGYSIGETTQDIKALVADAGVFGGPGFLVPTRNAELMRWCLESGLRIVQPMTLMTMGEYSDPLGAYLPSIVY